MKAIFKMTRVFFDKGEGATLYRLEDGRGVGFYYSGGLRDATILACAMLNLDCDFSNSWSYLAEEVLTTEEIEKIKSGHPNWREDISVEIFLNSIEPPFNGEFCSQVWEEVQKQQITGFEPEKEQ